MKKYLVFGISAQLGGVESFLINYISAMQDKENCFEFVIFDRVPDFFLKSALGRCRVHIVPVRTREPISYYKKMEQLLVDNEFDVLWYNVCTLSDITLLKLAKKHGIPCKIVHSHNNENMGGKLNGILHRMHKKQVIKYADKYFACSPSAAEFMFPIDRIDNKNIKIIKNAIYAEKYCFSNAVREKLRHILGLRDEIVIGHVGRFHFQKNHEFILDVFYEILKTDENAKLLLVGNGNLKQQIIEKAQKNNFADNIILLENRTDVNELMQVMDVFLFPSLFEGFGIALLEAQAADLACVISDTIPDEVRLTNKIYPLSLKKSAEEWAEKILEVVRKDNRANALEVIRGQGYDIKENARQLKQFFADSIQQGNDIGGTADGESN